MVKTFKDFNVADILGRSFWSKREQTWYDVRSVDTRAQTVTLVGSGMFGMRLTIPIDELLNTKLYRRG